ncbi:cuticle protein CP14.6-like [Anopheles aquasalis]|uniref:cuticle protein CP14.6-like n=1 Tax=Anopheles aquasalis TaxID=42839 RepID=UPI00215A2F93|nr:cuticle protein CP14.6-like [Anopheles aquasalis]
MCQKSFVVLSCLLAVACAAPAPPAPAKRAAGGGGADADATVVAQDQIINEGGSYAYNFETSNGIKARQASDNGVNANGEFSFLAPDGTQYSIVYVADENGFQPQGAHLPVEPPAPDHVIKQLEDIRANPPNTPEFSLAALDATLARLRATQG